MSQKLWFPDSSLIDLSQPRDFRAVAGNKVLAVTSKMGRHMNPEGAEEHRMNEIVSLENFLTRTKKEIDETLRIQAAMSSDISRPHWLRGKSKGFRVK